MSSRRNAQRAININTFLNFLNSMANQGIPVNRRASAYQLISYITPRQFTNWGPHRANSLRVRFVNPGAAITASRRASNAAREQRAANIFRRLGASNRFIESLLRKLRRAAKTPSPPRNIPRKRNSPPPPNHGGVSVRGSKRARTMAAAH